MTYPYGSMVIGIMMMIVLTVFVMQFTNNSETNCKDNSNGYDKCMQLMNGMKSLIYFSWPIYIGGMIVFSLAIRKKSGKNHTFDAGWEPKQ